MISGLAAGLLLAFFMKRSRLCFAGGLRDIYMKKKLIGLKILFIVFSLQGAIYFSLVRAGLVSAPEAKSFSLLATILGAFLFGFGAILANGCTVSMLIKAGDGRLNGFVGLLSFLLVVLSSKEGLLHDPIKALQETTPMENAYAATHLGLMHPIFLILAAIAIYLVILAVRKHKAPKYALPAKYTGLFHVLLEKNWMKEISALCIGLTAGVSFYLSEIAGRVGGWGITTPLYSWAHAFTTTEPKLSWASFFVLGIFLGGALWGILFGEWSIKVGDARSVLFQILGGALMAFGAVLAKGCLVGFGMTGLAQGSIQGLVGIVAICVGLWGGAALLYMRKA